jgi:hypothetical protein
MFFFCWNEMKTRLDGIDIDFWPIKMKTMLYGVRYAFVMDSLNVENERRLHCYFFNAFI